MRVINFGSYYVSDIMHLLPETEVLRTTGLDHLALAMPTTSYFQHIGQYSISGFEQLFEKKKKNFILSRGALALKPCARCCVYTTMYVVKPKKITAKQRSLICRTRKCLSLVLHQDYVAQICSSSSWTSRSCQEITFHKGVEDATC